MNQRIKALLHLCICILLCSGIVINIFSTYTNWAIRKDAASQIENLSYLQKNNGAVSEKKDYYSSDEYKQKLFKQEGLKIKNEVVIEMGVAEIPLGRDDINYTPVNTSSAKNNMQLWIQCFFSNQQVHSHLDSFCK